MPKISSILNKAGSFLKEQATVRFEALQNV
jgi:hypothetical protein